MRLRITQELNLKFNNAEYFVKSIREEESYPIEIETGRNPDASSQPLRRSPKLARKHTSAVTVDLAIDANQWEEAKKLMGTTNGKTYEISWQLPGSNLKQWFNENKLYLQNGVLHLTLNFFLTKFRGKHYLKWVESNGYEIYDAKPYIARAKEVSTVHNGEVQLHRLGAHTNQLIQFDIDLEVIRVPSDVYVYLEKRFTGISFIVNENINSEDYKRFQGSCNALDKKPELADFKIRISRDVHFILKTHHLIKYGENGKCTVLIECPGYVTPRHEESEEPEKSQESSESGESGESSESSESGVSEESDVMDDHTQDENQNEPWVLGSPYF